MKICTSRRRRGFTMIELLVVIAIIVVLAGLSVGGYGYVSRKQADSQAAVHIALLSKGLEEYKLDNGVYPPTGNSNSLYMALYWNGATTSPPGKIYVADLDPSSKNQGWNDGTTGAGVKILDPWGNEYIYTNGSDPSAKNPDFDIASKGKDATIGTADDIDNY